MSIANLLEDFGSLSHGTPVSITDVVLEEQRLEAFENGYQAGWDDAVKAQSDDSRKISASLSQNLQDMEFSYQEACTDVLSSLKPLLQQLVSVVLPDIARLTLGARLSDVLLDVAKSGTQNAIEIVCCPRDHAALEQMAEQNTGLKTKIVSDPTLSEGQVFARLDQEEREVDLGGVLTQIDSLVAGFFEENRRKTA